MRLDKYISSQGNYSRKDIKEIVKNGRISVNGTVATSVQTQIDPEKTEVLFDNNPFSYKKNIYIMMNKPKGVLSAAKDSQKTVIDLLPEHLKRNGLFPAGRLDKDTEGLLIITDDGDFAHKLLSPSSKIEKEYYAEIDSKITGKDIEIFSKGTRLADGTVCLPAKLSVFKEEENQTVSVIVFEGKYHQIKRMLGTIGAGVVNLKRVRIGEFLLSEDFSSGECRELSSEETSLLFNKQQN